MFSKFSYLLKHINDKGASRSRNARYETFNDQRTFGHFMFLIRSLMIRHSQSQVYRGTNPPQTLMSLPQKVSTSKRTSSFQFEVGLKHCF